MSLGIIIGEGKQNIVTDKTTLKRVAKIFNLEFDLEYKYYTGNAYVNSKGEDLPTSFELNGRTYMLKYFSGCFNPFLVIVN